MQTLLINDLPLSNELDFSAMAAVQGGDGKAPQVPTTYLRYDLKEVFVTSIGW